MIGLITCFNTQPPEGGWQRVSDSFVLKAWFQHTAARRRLETLFCPQAPSCRVSTHSRPKAAGQLHILHCQRYNVSTHSRPKAAGRRNRPALFRRQSFNTQPPEGGWIHCYAVCRQFLRFQHTAARRRLAMLENAYKICVNVSTHSRPKAAGMDFRGHLHAPSVSTHSRPKAAGFTANPTLSSSRKFQHTAARRRLADEQR